MKTLTIKDLARSEQLDRGAMASVRGGTNVVAPSYNFTFAPQSDSSIHGLQNLTQFQGSMNSVADGSAFVDCLHVTNRNDQFGQNNIYVGAPAAVPA